MEALELTMYLAGLGLDIWFMAHIPKIVRGAEEAIDRRRKAGRPRTTDERMADAIRQIRAITEEEGNAMERKYVGVIKAGELVKISGDPESVRGLAETEMAREIERLRRENSRLSAELGLVKTGRARDIKRRRVVAVRAKRRPEWFEGAKVRLLTWWAVKTLGVEAVYGESKPLPEMVRVRGGWVPARKIVAGGTK